MNNFKLFTIALLVGLMSFGSVSQAQVLDGAKEWNGHYYKAFEPKVKWDYAKKFCESMGGYLAIIDNNDENDAVIEASANGAGWYYWIGGYRDSNQMWRWINGKAITGYSNWASGQSLNYDRLVIIRSVVGLKPGQWYTESSSWTSCGFICEWNSAEDAHESTM